VGVPDEKGYRLIKISRVVDGENLNEQQRAGFKQQLQKFRAQAEYAAYLASLRANTEIKIREGTLETR
jgi:hypothetical protein